MKISQEFNSALHIIRSYDKTGITIDDQRYTHSIIVSSDSLEAFSPTIPDILGEKERTLLEGLAPELIILGTGDRLVFPHVSVSAFFMQQGIGFEVMDTAAACRTYNVLVSEGRKVAAALVVNL